ncbi:MAG: hypothetical protein Q4D61_00935 [Cardiobacteriaceae bacterium]|nr:hypothetical protein [Cardiobacteriaceae bacterium]
MKTFVFSSLWLAGTAFAAPEALLPTDFQRVVERAVQVDGEACVWQRWQAASQPEFAPGGEHVSVVHDAAGRLKGFADMRLARAGAPLPDEAQAQAAADAFLRNHAPDLLEAREVHWIAPHTETLRVAGEAQALAGMKVKMRNTRDGRWFWVIVAADGAAMVFERDIVWLTMPGRRQSEQWLHDDWLLAKGVTP